MSSVTRAFGNLLAGALSVKSSRLLQDANGSPDAPAEFDHIVFWTVNAIWMALLILVAIWFCTCNGSERISQWTRSNASLSSDQIYTTQVSLRREEAAVVRKLSPEKQLKLLQQTWNDNEVIMVVQKTDFVNSSATNEGDVETGSMEFSDDGSSLLSILLSNDKRHLVPNCCAVCLCSYEVGESVVWSNDCMHCFHEACVSDWLIKMQDGLPCPCCRQRFVDLDNTTTKEEKVTSAPRPTLDVSVVHL